MLGDQAKRATKKMFLRQLSYSQFKQYTRLSQQALQCQTRTLSSSSDASSSRTTSRVRPKDGRHVLDGSIAERLARTIISQRDDPSAPLIHVEAGPGLVCREFLVQGVSSVIALESTKNFVAEHQVIQEEHSADRFQSVTWPMLSLRQKLGAFGTGSDSGKGRSLYTQAEAHVSQLLQERTNVNQGYSIFNIGAKAKNEYYDFLFYILRNMPNDDPIISLPRVDFFFLAHPRFKAKLDFLSHIESASHATRYSSIMAAAYLLYDISFIGEFDADAFKPPFGTSRAVQDPAWVDPRKRLLVRLRLKPDIESVLPFDHHVNFLIFLRQLYTKKVNRTIATMEMLVPGCGLRMLALDFTMMDIILRTRPERLLVLYKHMVEWPEYQLSPLRNYILQKTRGGLDHWPEDDKGEKMDSSV